MPRIIQFILYNYIADKKLQIVCILSTVCKLLSFPVLTLFFGSEEELDSQTCGFDPFHIVM